jgi:hypothetical protein
VTDQRASSDVYPLRDQDSDQLIVNIAERRCGSLRVDRLIGQFVGRYMTVQPADAGAIAPNETGYALARPRKARNRSLVLAAGPTATSSP